MRLWKQNPRANKQPTCPKTGKALLQIPPPEVKKEYVKCHCNESRFSIRRGTFCLANCEGYEPGKCPICRCPCEFYTDVTSYRNIRAIMLLQSNEPEPRIPSVEARAFLDTSSNVRQLTSSASACHFQRQIASGNKQLAQITLHKRPMMVRWINLCTC